MKIHVLTAKGPSAVFNSMFQCICVKAFLDEKNARDYIPAFTEACCDPDKGIHYAERETLRVHVVALDVPDGPDVADLQRHMDTLVSSNEALHKAIEVLQQKTDRYISTWRRKMIELSLRLAKTLPEDKRQALKDPASIEEVLGALGVTY